jgi:phosphoenolpyruvate carboxykinase (ATP)
VPAAFLDPRSTWADGAAYDRTAEALARMFADNFVAYAGGVSQAIRDAGPVVSDWTPPATPRPSDPSAG